MTLKDAIESAAATLSRQKDGWSDQAARLLLQHFPANQAQDATQDQLRRAIPVIEAAGLYDAADAIKRAFKFE
jgi:hypothetical protein